MKHKEITVGSSNKIMIFADLHAHDFKQFSEPEGDSSTRLKWTSLVLIKLFEYAITNNIKHIFFLGDLLHPRTVMKSIVFAKIAEIIESFTAKGIQLHFITGNHDFIYNSQKSPVVVKQLNYIDHANEPTIYNITDHPGVGIATLPFQFKEKDLRDNLEHLGNGLEGSERNILLGHFEVSGAIVSDEYVLSKPFDMDEFKTFPFTRIISGHVHKRQMLTFTSSNGTTSFFWFIGTPLQNNFGDEGNPYGFMVYDFTEDKAEFVETKSLIAIPEFRTIQIKTAQDIKDFLKDNKGRLEFDYFHFEIHDPELKADLLFDKTHFYTTDQIFIPEDGSLADPDNPVRFDMDLREYLSVFIEKLKSEGDLQAESLDWYVPQEMEHYLKGILGDKDATN